MKTRFKLLNIVLVTLLIMSCSATVKNPMACCMVPTTGIVGQPILFNSTCSTDASKYKWDFGDGTSTTDANPSHTYSTAGNYTVKLMAMNSDESKMNETAKVISITK